MKRLALWGSAALILFVVAACDPTKKITFDDERRAACAGYAEALDTAALHRELGQLSDAQIANVDAVRPFLNNACSDTFDQGDMTQTAFLRAIRDAMIRLEANNG